jgi:hypothetical protein
LHKEEEYINGKTRSAAGQEAGIQPTENASGAQYRDDQLPERKNIGGDDQSKGN